MGSVPDFALQYPVQSAPAPIRPVMQERYEPSVLEPAAQQYWDENGSFAVVEDPSRPKYYCL
jgi:leucyl-tRNA synthetase